MRTVDGQPPQQGRRQQRIAGKLLGDRFRQLAELAAISREGLITEDGFVLADRDKWGGDLSPGFLTGPMVEIVIELWRPRVESGPVVGGIERLYPILSARLTAHRQASFRRYSRAALRNTAPGLGGLRMAFAKASVSRAVRTNMDRLAIVCSAYVLTGGVRFAGFLVRCNV
ncbi:MAG: hypothetical protein ABSG03_07625 [Bryobacteraceae bacterium]